MSEKGFDSESEELVEAILQSTPGYESRIFERYADRLTAYASARMPGKLSGRVDSDDIVQSVFRSFFRRNRDGEFSFEDSLDLWKLLVAMTYRKVLNQVRHHSRKNGISIKKVTRRLPEVAYSCERQLCTSSSRSSDPQFLMSSSIIFDLAPAFAAGNGAISYAQFTITQTTNSNSENIYAGTIPGPGVELHYAVVLDHIADTGTLFINGVSVFTENITLMPSDVMINDAIQHNWLGRSRFTQDSYMDGSIEEFRIYNHALSGSEVLVSFQRGPNTIVPEPGTSVLLTLAGLIVAARRRGRGF